MQSGTVFVLGLLAGLGVGALAIAGVLRGVGRLAGGGPGEAVRLALAGLRPGGHRDGVAVQRALARRLKRSGERTASGRRVAATTLQVHVGPEDHDRVVEALGAATAQTDLAEFYAAHAHRSGWVVHEEPRVELVRDISLRSRQAFVRATTRAAQPAARADQASLPGAAARRPPVEARASAVTAPLRAREGDEMATDVLPRGLLDDAGTTLVLPADLLPPAPSRAATTGLGDLVIVHGTDVRTVAPGDGVLRIGRGPHNDVVLDAPGVARDHLVVEVRGDAWWIVPASGEGGTLIDGAALRGPVLLTGQALLDLGRGVRVRLAVAP